MANGRNKLKADTVLKNYWNDNKRFADFFNAVIFKGKEVINPQGLEDVDTESSSILENKKYAEAITASRDNIKIHKKSTQYGIHFVMLGIEGQEHIHYAMPLRVMGYDYSTYKKQYNNNASRYKKAAGLDEDEYLSKMKKTDKFVPVITVVLYYGEKPWDGAKSLYGMLDIPEEIKEYVNDYKMHLIEARQHNLILNNTDNKDFFNLLGIMLNKDLPVNEAKEKAICYSREHKTDKSVIMAAAGAANAPLDYNLLNKEGEDIMCTLFKKLAEENRTEGLAEGLAKGLAEGIIETGLECGLSENDIIGKLQKKLNLSLQEAQEYLKKFSRQLL